MIVGFRQRGDGKPVVTLVLCIVTARDDRRRAVALLPAFGVPPRSRRYLRVHFGDVPQAVRRKVRGSSLSGIAGRIPRAWSGLLMRCGSSRVERGCYRAEFGGRWEMACGCAVCGRDVGQVWG